MDPTIALRDALRSLRSEESRLAAIDRLRDLAEWLQKGGFLPDVPRAIPDELVDDLFDDGWPTEDDEA